MTALSLIMLVPIITRTLGVSYLGLWEVILAFVGIITVVQSVLNFTLLWKFSSNCEYKTTLIRWIRIGLFFSLFQVFFFLVPIFIFPDQIIDFLGKVQITPYNLKSIFLQTATITLLSSIVEVFATLLNSLNSSGKVSILLGISQVFGILATYILLQKYHSFLGVFQGFLIQKLIYAVCIIYYCRKKIPFKLIYPIIPSRQEFNEVRKYLFFMFIGSIIVLFRDQFVKIAISNISDLNFLGNYAVVSKLSLIVFTVCSFFSIPLMSAIATLYAKKDTAAINDLMKSTTYSVAILGTYLVLVLLWYIDKIMIVLIGHCNNNLILLSNGVMLCSLFVSNLTIPISGASKAIGRADIETRYVLVNMALTFLVFMALNVYRNAYFLVMSTYLAWVISSVYFLMYFKKSTDFSIQPILQVLKLSLLVTLTLLIKLILNNSVVIHLTPDNEVLYMVGSFLVLSALYIFALHFLNIFSYKKWAYFAVLVKNGLH